MSLAQRLPVALEGHPRIIDTPKRVRVLFHGQYIVDTTKAKLVWEKPFYPTYFFPISELSSDLLHRSADAEHGGVEYDLVVGRHIIPRAVVVYNEGELKGLLKILFGAADAWLEEDERIYVHPKDPYKRVDVLQSSRHVVVKLNGVELANTRRPRLLFETGLRVRTYIPLTDVRVDFLRPSNTVTACPYKGEANYYNVELPNGETSKDIVWYYRVAQLECAQITGFVAFYDEKVEVWVDGEKQ
ncbi:DUF427-domain-containing protein [Coniophora puteana RWD-64-598 SS2]|uniref:DUF427-domain-containing protein n=1 Tax=Coniophora puteana (strain RWD-64-598) TaxID=741705 RepID=A0A5M3MY94_CONPW|nr:DUF427-domain-containing protein [Coniophora puteana RWD-64-598 SS2]EIW83997.1 DUF427-domain-containing protein [Coniophora puteana RWD-64-598 SS2]